jgi:predicted permease
MDTVWRDLRYGFRTLLRSPGFTLVAVLSLALGIGANTAIFTLTNAVFLNPLPVKDAGRVIEVYTVDHATQTTAAGLVRTAMSYPNYRDFRDQNNVFSSLATFLPIGVITTGRGEPKPQNAMLLTANYFDTLGVKPIAGRTFMPDEDRSDGGNTVAVLSYSMWMRLFGGDAGAIGKTVELNGVPYTVIGVAPRNFKGTFTVGSPDLVFVPLSMHAQILPAPLEKLFMERRMRMMNVFGRLKPGVQQAQAEAEFKTLASALEREYPKANNGRSTEMSSLSEAALGFLPRDQATVASLALSAVVGLVLLIACVNVANLQLARSARRAREMGIRTALGAERSRLVRQLLTESLLVSAAGGVCGLGVGLAGSQLLWSFRPAFLTANSLDVTLDWHVFAFTAAVTVFTGALFGLAPAFRTSLANVAEVLKSGGRGGAEGIAGNRLRSLLVTGEVALALIALSGAGLLIRSMQQVQKINPGFETHNLFAFNFDIGPQHYPPERGLQFMHDVMRNAAGVPGVHSAALSTNPPIGGGLLATLTAEGQESDPNHRGTLTNINTVSANYFDTMRIPILRGRGFTEFDSAGTAPVAVITDAMARHFWPGQEAIGKRFKEAIGTQYRQVIGICANSVVAQIGEDPQPVAYYAMTQQYSPAMVLITRTDRDPSGIMPAVMRSVQQLNGNMALQNPQTIQEILRDGLWAPRTGAALFGVFGLLGMLLASVGIYGVMAYMVTQRSNEIGLRMALGATPGSVLRLVVGQGMRLTVAGIVVGLVAGMFITRLMGTMLFNVPTYDPVTFGGVTVVVAAVALIAGWLPARRAAHIDPVRALRQD